MSVNQVELTEVTKKYWVRERAGIVRRSRREVRAVDDVSFSVSTGEFVGYLGANGAGKSTTIKMMTGVLAPTDGVVRVRGRDPFRERKTVARELGVMFGQRSQLWWDLPLYDSYEQLRLIYDVPRSTYVRRLDDLVSVLELGPFMRTPVRQLSLGQRIRGEIAAALAHSPSLVFLDEPTIGVDVMTKQRIREFLVDLNHREGITVLLTTHDLEDVERMCSRLILLAAGRVTADGRIEDLLAAQQLPRTLVVDLDEPATTLTLSRGEVVRREGPRYWIRFRSTDVTVPELVSEISDQARLIDLSIREPRVEDLVTALHRSSELEPERHG